MKNKRVLISCGPTWCALDSMRVLSNTSTGEMGHALAKKFLQHKARVTLLEGPVTHRAVLKSVKRIPFRYFEELYRLIRKEARSKDIIVHAAAVSDYQLKKPFKNKISSELKTLKLTLRATPKIINSIKEINPNVFLVGFKLEPSLNENSVKEKIKKLITKARCDLVVANTIGPNQYSAFIADKEKILARVDSKGKLASALVGIIKRKV